MRSCACSRSRPPFERSGVWPSSTSCAFSIPAWPGPLVSQARSKDIVRLVSAHVTTQQQVRPSLNGVDLKAMGLKPGPIYKKILDRLLEARLNGEVKTKADERELAKKLAKV